MKAGSKLISFHKKCKIEYNELLEHFNLLFYGYGCKKKLLEFLFPDSIIINCKFCSLAEAIDEIIRHTQALSQKTISEYTKHRNINALLAKLDDAWKARDMQTRLIFLNFEFKELAPLSKTKNFKIIGTIEDTACLFSHYDVRSFNFIFRDLTTFVPYTDEIVDIALSRVANRVESTLHIYENVSKKAKQVFVEFLRLKSETKSVFLQDIFNSLRKKLLLKARSECQVLLSEFLDHQILKIRCNEEVATELTGTDVSMLLKQLCGPVSVKSKV